MGSRGRLPLRPLGAPRPGIRHRHAATDRQWCAAHRPRVQLHPHRHGGAFPSHARQVGVLPDRLGRQRSGHRAPSPELHGRPLRPLAALRPGLHAALQRRRPERSPRRPGESPQLRRAVPQRDPRRRGGVRAARPPTGHLHRLVAPLHDHRRTLATCQPTRVPSQPRSRRGVPTRRADVVRHRRTNGRRPGRDGRPRRARRLAQAGVPPRRWRW